MVNAVTASSRSRLQFGFLAARVAEIGGGEEIVER
jgi:hypothetical protein